VSAPQFTPGPWEWWDDGQRLVRITEAAEQKLIAQTILPSNARLIAAAPELYEALKALADFINMGEASNIDVLMQNADAALAKARGEQ
jgi:hypothetical protein